MPIAMEDGAALCQRCLIVLGVVEVNASDVVQVSNDMPNLDAGSKERTAFSLHKEIPHAFLSISPFLPRHFGAWLRKKVSLFVCWFSLLFQ